MSENKTNTDATPIRAQQLTSDLVFDAFLHATPGDEPMPKGLQIHVDQAALNRLVAFYVAAKPLRANVYEDFPKILYYLLDVDEELTAEKEDGIIMGEVSPEEHTYDDLRIIGLRVCVLHDGDVVMNLIREEDTREVWATMFNVRDYLEKTTSPA